MTRQSTHTGEQFQGRHSGTSPVGVLQSHLSCTTAQNRTSETPPGASTPIAREQIPPLTGQCNHRAKGRSHSISSASPGHHNISLPKAVLSLQPPQNILLDTALPTRGTRPSRGQSLEARGTTLLHPVERRPQTQKPTQKDMAREIRFRQRNKIKPHKNN